MTTAQDTGSVTTGEFRIDAELADPAAFLARRHADGLYAGAVRAHVLGEFDWAESDVRVLLIDRDLYVPDFRRHASLAAVPVEAIASRALPLPARRLVSQPNQVLFAMCGEVEWGDGDLRRHPGEGYEDGPWVGGILFYHQRSPLLGSPRLVGYLGGSMDPPRCVAHRGDTLTINLQNRRRVFEFPPVVADR